ncbi:MAG: hypothetical protein ACTSXD_06895 [Candidatus Heimdallarchaeaceae archaeon]
MQKKEIIKTEMQKLKTFLQNCEKEIDNDTADAIEEEIVETQFSILSSLYPETKEKEKNVEWWGEVIYEGTEHTEYTLSYPFRQMFGREYEGEDIQISVYRSSSKMSIYIDEDEFDFEIVGDDEDER